MIVEIDHVSKTIKGTEVLHDISLTVDRGEVLCLTGVNGSGKTMLLRCVLGLVRPTTGTVSISGRVLGRDIDFPPSVGMLLEGPAFLPAWTGRRNLAFLSELASDTDPDMVGEVIRSVGLDPCDKRRYSSYSLGMKQRLGIAAALYGDPELIILDEPTNALDAEGTRLVHRLIGEHRDRGAAILLATHDRSLVRDLADCVVNLAEGHIEEAASC